MQDAQNAENRLYLINIEDRDVPVMAHTIAPRAKVYADYPYNIPDNAQNYPDSVFTGAVIIPPPSNVPPKDIENAIADILNNSWLLIIGGSIILMIVVCAFALIYYFKKQKKLQSGAREPSVYRFNS